MSTCSNARLLIVFVIALLVFLPLRWDATPWLQTQSRHILQKFPFPVDVGEVTFSTQGVGLTDLIFTPPPPAEPLRFSHITLSPVWGALFTGTPTFQASLSSDVINGQLNVAYRDGYAELSAIQLSAKVPWIQTQWAADIPVSLQGEADLTGEVQLYMEKDMAIFMPVAATLNLAWQAAGVRLGESSTALGDYQLLVKGEPSSAWSWQINGGELLKIEGQGSLQNQAALAWLLWPLEGQLDITNAPESPLSALLGKKQHITFSGTLQTPQWHM